MGYIYIITNDINGKAYKCKTLNSGVRTHISEVCNYKPKRKTAYGYIWKYREMDMADGRLVSQPVS